MFKVAKGLAACSLLFMCGGAVAEEVSDSSSKEEKASSSDKKKKESGYEDSFLNIKFAHERDNNYPLGPKNSSAVALTPYLAFDNWRIDADAYYGRQFSYNGHIKKPTYWWGTIPDHDRADFYETFGEKFNGKKRKEVITTKVLESTLNKPHFYRNYTRAVYTNKNHNFRAMIGDTRTSNTIGFQQGMTGGGISVFRQDGNGSVIGAGDTILLGRPSRIEYRIDGQFTCMQNFASGLYSIEDLTPEARIPGASIKIRDQIDRSDVIKIDYFSGYGMLAQGKDDFDFTVLCNHTWHLEDPYRIRYTKKPRYSANYRYGFSDDITAGIGAQAYEKAFTIDSAVIFSGAFGKISPNIAYSDSRAGEKTRRTGGYGIFYALPENDAGIFFEALLAYQGRGYSDLGVSEDVEKNLDEIIDEYFAGDAKMQKFKSRSSEGASTRKVTLRLYTKPIWGITPAFIFNSEWSSSADRLSDKRLREYTLCFTTRIYKTCSIILIGGLSYDDPSMGNNRRSPDKRLNLTCSWDITPEFMVEGTFLNFEDKQKRTYGHMSYRPEAVKGLETDVELWRRPGMSGKIFTVKYDADFFDVKVVHEQYNSYDDKTAQTSNGHNSEQTIYLGTSVSKDGFSTPKKNSFNIIR
ncbi:MAG: hypothetical protein LBL99_01715 [Holosporaceae bacterium]|jgi:hypothetical protein|nr:hypothetical protein [Holosporaceae bacterium]